MRPPRHFVPRARPRSAAPRRAGDPEPGHEVEHVLGHHKIAPVQQRPGLCGPFQRQASAHACPGLEFRFRARRGDDPEEKVQHALFEKHLRTTSLSLTTSPWVTTGFSCIESYVICGARRISSSSAVWGYPSGTSWGGGPSGFRAAETCPRSPPDSAWRAP